MPSVVVVGSINTDFVLRVPRFPSPGETLAGDSFAIHGGGKGANQALAARRMGADVRMVGAGGSDSESRARREALAAEGVDVAHIGVHDGFGGVALILVESSTGQNQIATYAGANGALEEDSVVAALDGWCGPGSLLCCQLEVPIGVVELALRAARASGGTTLLNAAPFSREAARLLELVDHLIVNEIEAGQLLERGPIQLDEAAGAARQLHERGPGVVVITLGRDGAWISESSTSVHLPARRVAVVDSTGAGDAFVGAYCASLIEGRSPLAAARIAVVAGTLTVQKPGAQSLLPTRAEVMTTLKNSSPY